MVVRHAAREETQHESKEITSVRSGHSNSLVEGWKNQVKNKELPAAIAGGKGILRMNPTSSIEFCGAMLTQFQGMMCSLPFESGSKFNNSFRVQIEHLDMEAGPDVEQNCISFLKKQ